MALTKGRAEARVPHRKGKHFLLPCVMLCLSGSAFGKAGMVEQKLRQHIQQEINQYLTLLKVQSNKQQIALTLAPRAEKLSCDNLQFYRPQANEAPIGRIAYRIECTAPSSWQSRAVARIQLWTDVLVASRTLQRTERLSHEMLKTTSVDLSTLNRAPIVEIKQILGMTVKRRIHQNDPIAWSMIERPEIIERGDQVTLLIRSEGFTASTKGIALESGIKGQRVKVENVSSGQIVEGIAIESGVVETELKIN